MENPLRFLIISAITALPFGSPSGADVGSPDFVDGGFATPNSVEGTLATTASNQRERGLQGWLDWKQQLQRRSGFAFGIDSQVHLLATDADGSPSDAAGNVFRFYGTWTTQGRGTANNKAFIFKVENRSALGNKVSPQALGPTLGYAGLFSAGYSDAGWILTNFHWRQRLLDGRLSCVIGQVDVTDYTDVNSLASPWSAFCNLAFQQNTIAAPSQGLGVAVLWHFDNRWAVLGGIADANGDPSDPFESAEVLFNSGETFKHLGIGWSPDWEDRHNKLIQVTFWQADDRVEAGVEGGQGVALLASARVGDWRPFFRAGYGSGDGTSMQRAVSIGTGYDARGGKDLFGVGLNWTRAPESNRDQYTIEAFYRYDPTNFLQITPSIQYIANPAHDWSVDDILVFGLRVRVVL